MPKNQTPEQNKNLFKKGYDPRRKGAGRPPKIGSILKALDEQVKGKVTDPDGNIQDISGGDVIVKMLVQEATDSKDKTLLRQIILMAKQEAREEVALQSAEQGLKERKLKAAAEKYEIENKLKQQRAEQRSKKEDAETSIKRFKAEQEEIKTGSMIKKYVDVRTMLYYFSFFQRLIDDSYSNVKSWTPKLKQLLINGKEHESENYIRQELKNLFEISVRELENEMKKDIND
jgi:hypothetical protein